MCACVRDEKQEKKEKHLFILKIYFEKHYVLCVYGSGKDMKWNKKEKRPK